MEKNPQKMKKIGEEQKHFPVSEKSTQAQVLNALTCSSVPTGDHRYLSIIY